MALYSALLPVMEANQWYRNGDHPEDRTINRINTGRIIQRHPTFKPHSDSLLVCEICSKHMGEHGKVNPAVYNGYLGTTDEVCPGDYIITHRNKDGRVNGYTVYKRQLFEFFYGPYKEPIA